MSNSGTEPRIVKQQFGLLNGGVFNEIVFPGRYRVDASGNKVVDEEYNTDEIRFTGAMGDLYVEPDTFYIQNDNELVMKRRKRDRQGNVISYKEMNVGKLDLAATQVMSDRFVSHDTAEHIVDAALQQRFLQQQELLKGLFKNNTPLTSAEITTLLDKLSNLDNKAALQLNRIQSQVNAQQGNKVDDKRALQLISRQTYDKEALRRLLGITLAEAEDAIANDYGVLGVIRQSYADSTLRHTNDLTAQLEQFSSATQADIMNTLQVLDSQMRGTYLSQDAFNTTMHEYVKNSALTTELSNYYTTSEINNLIAQYTDSSTLATEYATKGFVQSALGGLSGISDSAAQHLRDNAEAFLRRDNLIPYLEEHENFKVSDLMKISQWSVEKQAITDELTKTENVQSELKQEDALLKGKIADVRGIVTKTLEQLGETFTDEMGNGMQFNDDALAAAFSEKISSLRARVASTEADTQKALLNLGLVPTDLAARSVALKQELADAEGKISQLMTQCYPDATNTTNLPAQIGDLQTRIDTYNADLQSTIKQQKALQNKLAADYLNVSDTTSTAYQSFLTAVVNNASSNLNGYTITQTQTILNRLFWTLYPEALGNLAITTGENCLVPRMLANARVSRIGADPLTLKYGMNKFQQDMFHMLSPSINGTYVSGADSKIADNTVLTQIGNALPDKIKVFLNNDSVYFVFPYDPANPTRWNQDRFRLEILDTTTGAFSKTATTGSKYKPKGIHYNVTVARDGGLAQSVSSTLVLRVTAFKMSSATPIQGDYEFDVAVLAYRQADKIDYTV